MTIKTDLTQERVNAMTSAGLWPDRILTDYFDEAVRQVPDRVAIAAANAETGVTTRLTYAELAQRVDAIAAGLAGLGVGRGDVVSFQLPNWWQFPAVYLACVRIGAVANPLMPIFRQRELNFMLNFAGSRVVIAPTRFRDFEYGAMMNALKPEVPSLEHVLLIGAEGEQSFEGVLLGRSRGPAVPRDRQLLPNELTELMYTSGTSGQPKAVMHVSNSLLGSALKYMEWIGLNGSDVVLMASPLAHQTGFIYGMMIAAILKTKLALLDVWSGSAAARVIRDEGATFTMASTPFLADLVNLPDADTRLLQTLRVFVCAGAPIPSVLVQRAAERLNFSVLSCWGMTENGGVTIAKPGDPPEKIFGTDGKAIEGMEVRVIDDDRKPVPAGTVGNLQARGMATFVGYMKKPELNSIDAEGWFDTGDRARMDAEGYIRITGRSKDVIIRGGENIPVVEIEGVLYAHDKVQDVAVVAMPDARLGERACAFVVAKPGVSISMDDIRKYLEAKGMAKQYWPERLEVLDAMPRTPSGKIQKFLLRERAAKFGPGA